MFRLARLPSHLTRFSSTNCRGLASSALLSRSWQNETLAELRNEAKIRGLSTKGSKSVLVSRLEEFEQTRSSTQTQSGIRHASTAQQVQQTAAPESPTEVPGNPEQPTATSAPFDIKMPDLSQPEPVEPIRIPFLPDFWDSSALSNTDGVSAEETLPKIVVIAGANTHRGGAYNLVDFSDNDGHEETSVPKPTAQSERSGSLLDDIAEDLGLPPVQDIKNSLRRLF